jgi:hypothetical protein
MLPRRWFALLILLGWLALAWSFLPARSYSAASFVPGQVLDDQGPVEGARVRWKGNSGFVYSDVYGRFFLPRVPGRSSRVTAWKAGYVIGGGADALPLTITLSRLPAGDADAYSWVDPAPHPTQVHNCGNCHREIYREWSHSSHAQAASNRRLLNLYDGSDWHGRQGVGWNLLADNRDGADVCNSCHGPTARYDADLRQLRGTARLGVHCDYCHKIVDSGAGTVGLTHGRYGLRLLRPAEGQLFFGPLDDVDRNEDSYAALYRESRYCASCHEGIVFGVHAYGTYSEWLESSARREGKQCQTCHMAPTGRFTNIAPGKGGIRRDPSTLASHHFPGGGPEMLRRALTLSVTMDGRSSLVQATVSILAHNVGHRVPTGFPDRNLVLVVDGVDDSGKVSLLQAGPRLPDRAGREVAGRPGKLFAKQLKDLHATGPAPFWRADPEFPDTRLVPDRPERSQFTFAAGTRRLRVRLLYRRFWPAVAEAKSWPENELVLLDQTLEVDGGKMTVWTGP